MTDLRRDELGEQVTLPRDAVELRQATHWRLPTPRPFSSVFEVIRWPDGRVLFLRDGREIIAELGPNDAELFAAWLRGEPNV